MAPQDDGDYEFAERSKESFRALAGSVSFVGACTMLLGVVGCVFLVGALIAGFVSIALGAAACAGTCLATAWWMMSAGRALSSLVGTRGRDVAHLMAAVAQLRRLFGLARVVIVLGSMAAVVVGSMVVWCAFAVDRGGKCFGAWNPFGFP